MFGGLKKKLKEAIGKFVAKEEPAEKFRLEEEATKAREPEPVKEPEIQGIEETEVKEEPVEKLDVEETERYRKLEEEIERIHEKEKQIEEEYRPEIEEIRRQDEQKIEEIRKKLSSEAMEKAEPVIEQVREEIDQIERELPRAKEEKEIIFPVEKEIEQPKPIIEKIEKPKEEKKGGFLSGLFGKQKKEKKKIEPEIKTEKKETVKPEPAVVEKPKEEKKGFLERIVKRVEEKTLTEEEVDSFLKDLNTALLESDVALEVADKICADVKKELVGKNTKRGKIEETINIALKNAMLDVMKQDKIDIEQLIEKKYSETKQPLLIIFFGFNGTGKTTSIAKFAHRLKKYRPVLAAGDTFRAAAIDQLEEHGRRIGVDVIKHNYGSDSAAVIFDAVKHAAARGSKVVLADTAGRSHSNVNLMDELKKVVRVNKPDLKVLVLDSITGNDIYDQSQLFSGAVGVDGVILTKADVYEKGGSALSASYTLKKPILFLGVGQEYGDLKDFVPEDVVKNLLE